MFRTRWGIMAFTRRSIYHRRTACRKITTFIQCYRFLILFYRDQCRMYSFKLKGHGQASWYITPFPILIKFKRLNNWVLYWMEIFSCMFNLWRVTTSYMTTNKAKSRCTQELPILRQSSQPFALGSTSSWTSWRCLHPDIILFYWSVSNKYAFFKIRS